MSIPEAAWKICNFRGSSALLSSLQQAAKSAKVSVSEFIRESIQMRLDADIFEGLIRQVEYQSTASNPDEKVQA